MFGRICRQNDQVEVGRVHARGLQCFEARRSREIRGVLVLRTDMSLFDSDDLRNKFVDVFADHAAEVVIGQNPLRNIRAGTNNASKCHLSFDSESL